MNSRLWMSTKSPFKDFRLRKALHLAVDRKRIGEQMFPAAPDCSGFLVAGPVGLPDAALGDPAGRARDAARIPL